MKYIFVTLISFLLVSCGVGNNFNSTGIDDPLSPQMSSRKVQIFADNNSNLDKKPYDDADKPIEQGNKRILTYNYVVVIESDNFENSSQLIEEITNTNNGYITYKSNNFLRIKVPVDKVEFYLNELKKAGKITQNSKSATDITLNYYDTKLRLENLNKSRERYLELLKQAENVETTLKVEKELERLLYEIESLKASMNNLENQIAYTSIDIYLKEHITLGPVSWVFYGLYKSVSWLFVW